ncbi:TIGR02757 family protein [Deferribacterales bacterium RsTz2092]|nr:TIGR02757 family protein [Deferribacterales bacterium]
MDTKIFCEYLYKKYNNQNYIHTDPIRFPHTYAGDKEFIAFTAAMFAYGNVKAMTNFLHNFFTDCGADPLTLTTNPTNLKYRFQSTSDVADYCTLMQRVYMEQGSLKNLLDKAIKGGATAPLVAVRDVVLRLRDYAPNGITLGLNFLLSVPDKSASKRLWLFLRWMIRRDEVDFGLWDSFKPSALSMPLDTHITRFATHCGLLHGEKGSRALAIVNNFFRDLTPEDPAKYDFALTRLGIANGCQYERSAMCEKCEDRKYCVFI